MRSVAVNCNRLEFLTEEAAQKSLQHAGGLELWLNTGLEHVLYDTCVFWSRAPDDSGSRGQFSPGLEDCNG